MVDVVRRRSAKMVMVVKRMVVDGGEGLGRQRKVAALWW